MPTRTLSKNRFLAVQLLVIAAFSLAFAVGGTDTRERLAETVTGVRTVPPVAVPRMVPLRVEPLYDAPEMLSDEDLAGVLYQVQPVFPKEHTKPNFVEHALRIWGVDAKFADPDVMSGAEMMDFLVNHGHYLASWGDEIKPLLQEEGDGVSIRWGREEGGSVHHDHWLASLTEAGVHLDQEVNTPSHRVRNINDVLQQSLRDFRVDEREVEWSAMAFGLWIPPAKGWTLTDGRHVTFDLLARRLIRGADMLGVCHGTHRLYSMMLLVRLDDDFHILSSEVRADILKHLARVRDTIVLSQFPDGHWPSNWPDGAAAVEKPVDDPVYRQVISTGHHLEWLAIAPEELHPPREQIHKAIRWVVKTTTEQPREAVQEKYTFFSHVGGALSLWRHTRATVFWQKWEAEHPSEFEAVRKARLPAQGEKHKEDSAAH